MTTEGTTLARKARPGNRTHLGATVVDGGVNFAVASTVAEAVTVCLFDASATRPGSTSTTTTPGSGMASSPTSGLDRPTATGCRDRGTRVTACAATRTSCFSTPTPGPSAARSPSARRCYGHDADDPAKPSQIDSAPYVPRSLVVDHSGYDWEGDTQLHRRSVDSVLYEVHVKGFTARHPDIPPEIRGTYAGLAHEAATGVPARPRRDRGGAAAGARVRARGLPHRPGPDQLLGLQHHRLLRAAPGLLGGGPRRPRPLAARSTSSRTWSRRCTGRASRSSSTWSTTTPPRATRTGRRSASAAWTTACTTGSWTDDASKYYDTTGTGNSLNASNPDTLRLIMDSLRYWMSEMHVDGFRFDLAATLGREGDDRFDQYSAFFDTGRAGPGDRPGEADRRAVGRRPGRQLRPGPVPRAVAGVERPVPGLHARLLARQRTSASREFATRFSGSSDLYGAARRRPTASVNLITVHDGFTLRDLVSYDDKHNEANGEDNRDGTDDNRSWNCGAEGPTDDPDDQRAARTAVTGDAVHAAAVVRPAAAARRRRDRPHPGRQQQRLLPGQRDLLVRLGERGQRPARLREAAARAAPRAPGLPPQSVPHRRRGGRTGLVQLRRRARDRGAVGRPDHARDRGLPGRHRRTRRGRRRHAVAR